MNEGVFMLSYNPINMSEIIKKITQLIIPKAEIKGLNCQIIVKNKFCKEILSDQRRLLQVILNLALNAIKYTFKGEVIIEFSLSKSKNLLKIKVKDTGIGIGPNELEQLSKLFGLLEKKAIGHETGIGIGLATTKGILNAMNGRLKITSKIGIGTICIAKVPISFQEIVTTDVSFFYSIGKFPSKIDRTERIDFNSFIKEKTNCVISRR